MSNFKRFILIFGEAFHGLSRRDVRASAFDDSSGIEPQSLRSASAAIKKTQVLDDHHMRKSAMSASSRNWRSLDGRLIYLVQRSPHDCLQHDMTLL